MHELNPIAACEKIQDQLLPALSGPASLNKQLKPRPQNQWYTKELKAQMQLLDKEQLKILMTNTLR